MTGLRVFSPFLRERPRAAGILSFFPAGLLVFIAVLLAGVGTAAPAAAEVRGTGEFMPGTWSSGDTASPARATRRTATRGRAAFRRAAVRSRASAARRYAARTRATRYPGIARAAVARPRVASSRRVRVASLGGGIGYRPAPLPSLTGGGIAWRANSGCLAGNLRSVLATVAASYGPLTVNSTCRSVAHNRRVGGARRSWHLTGNAADFRMRGNVRGAIAYLSGVVGGLKHYGGGRFHIDNGPRRRF